MSDQELLDALSVLARRFGLLERGQRLAIVGDPRDEQPTPAPPRLKFAPDYRCEVATRATFGTWSCSRERGHDGPCAASPAAEPCGARNAAENHVMAGQVCSLPRGHDGSHEATVNGQRWVFGLARPILRLPCDECNHAARCVLDGCARELLAAEQPNPIAPGA